MKELEREGFVDYAVERAFYSTTRSEKMVNGWKERKSDQGNNNAKNGIIEDGIRKQIEGNTSRWLYMRITKSTQCNNATIACQPLVLVLECLGKNK